MFTVRYAGCILRCHPRVRTSISSLRDLDQSYLIGSMSDPTFKVMEEQAINKVWKELKAQDPDRNYTEEGRKALRAYLKQWSIQNENFQRLYRKYDISVMDESVARESIATGSNARSVQKVCRPRCIHYTSQA